MFYVIETPLEPIRDEGYVIDSYSEESAREIQTGLALQFLGAASVGIRSYSVVSNIFSGSDRSFPGMRLHQDYVILDHAASSAIDAMRRVGSDSIIEARLKQIQGASFARIEKELNLMRRYDVAALGNGTQSVAMNSAGFLGSLTDSGAKGRRIKVATRALGPEEAKNFDDDRTNAVATQYKMAAGGLGDPLETRQVFGYVDEMGQFVATAEPAQFKNESRASALARGGLRKEQS